MDENASGKLLFIVLAATLLAVIAALGVARRYGAAMKRLMSLPAPPQDVLAQYRQTVLKDQPRLVGVVDHGNQFGVVQ